MAQIGNTGWITADTNSNALITDTYIDENAPTGGPHSTSNNLYLKGGSGTEKCAILDITIPNAKDLVDSNSNDLPGDVEFSKIELRINVSTDPTTGTHVVAGQLLKTPVSIALCNWNTTDGTTAWAPDLGGGDNADGDDMAVVYNDTLCTASFSTSSLGWNTFTFQNLAKNKIGFGSNFQLIFYSASDEIVFDSANYTSADPPELKVYFKKPEPDPATITVTPNELGLTGDVNITKQTSDSNLQKYYVCWDTSANVIQTDNPYTLSDTGVTKIPIKDLTQAAKTGTPAYAKRFPMAFRETTFFKVFSEDLYNTTTNATGSNEVAVSSKRPNIGEFKSYNSAGAADTAPTIGEEMTLTVAPVDLPSGVLTEYAINFDVDASLIDTGITWEDDVGGSTMTSTNSNAAYTKLYNSDPDAFELGDMLRITSAAGTEYMSVVGYDTGFTVVKRAQMNTAAVNHTGLTDSTKIYKINYDDFHFVKLKHPSKMLSTTHRFSKASVDVHTNHVAIMVKNEDGWCSDPESLNGNTGVTVAEANPIAKLTTSRTKVPYAKYGDQTTGFTLSLANSKAVGNNRKINHYGFAYDAGDSKTVATANALSNNNDCFKNGSKRCELVATGADNLTDSTWRIFGWASYASNGTTKVADSDPTFSHYKYVSEQITAGARSGSTGWLTPVISSNYWKNIECVVCEEIDSDDDQNRFLLSVCVADYTLISASTVNEGGGDGGGLSSAEVTLTVVSSSFYKPGDIVKIEDELCLVEAVPSSTSLTLRRGFLWTTGASHADGQAVNIVDSDIFSKVFINKELRANSDAGLSSQLQTLYMWGGFAQLVADNIDFESTVPSMHVDSYTGSSSWYSGGFAPDWYAIGFCIGDIIKVKSSETANGTYAAPGYYKIMDIFQSAGSGASNTYDTVYLAEHADQLTTEEEVYVSTSLTDNDDETADIVRYDNANKPTITCALYNYNTSSNAYAGDSDTVTFKGVVIDDDTTSFLANTDSDTLTVRGVGLNTLDLNTLADSGDISISNYSIKRNGGASATMPLGDRRYPIGGTASRLGVVDMTVNIRILTQAGYRQIYSLIEGDRYDYVFLESNDVDTPSSAYKSYRMKLNSGTLNKTSELASQYTAALNLLVLGEEIS